MTTAESKIKIPKHLSVAEALRRQIQSGKLKVGDRLPSYSQAREMFGAHTVTLEKAHALLEREGLITRERGRGTFVAQTAEKRGKRKKNRVATGMVGVAGFGFEFTSQSSYWAMLMGGLNVAARSVGSQILLLDYRTTEGWEKADGLILCDWTGRDSIGLVPLGMPLVSLLVPVEGVASVFADDFGGAKRATEHLLALGHQKIAFLHPKEQMVVSRRRAGWQEALREAGIEAQPSWERILPGDADFGPSFAEAGRRSVADWLQDDWDAQGFTALLAHNDHTALGAIEALRGAGKCVPLDVSVMGFDGGEICQYVSPPLCSVEVPLGLIGQKAMELLLAQINGTPQSSQQCCLETKLQARKTTGPAKE